MKNVHPIVAAAPVIWMRLVLIASNTHVIVALMTVLFVARSLIDGTMLFECARSRKTSH